MIRSISAIRTDKTKTLLHIEALSTIQRLEVDRSESTFGGKASLTQEEIAQSMILADMAKKRTAW